MSNCAVNLGFHEYDILHPVFENECIRALETLMFGDLKYKKIVEILDFKICKKCGYKTPRHEIEND